MISDFVIKTAMVPILPVSSSILLELQLIFDFLLTDLYAADAYGRLI